MRICHYATNDDTGTGLVIDHAVYQLEASMFDPDLQPGHLIGPVDDIRLLPPIAPGKIICVGRNYVAHAEERGHSVPDEPLLFFKPPSAIIGCDDAIELLPDMGLVHHEAELAVVIGRRGRFISEDKAFEHILGYTCANDVSARDYQARDGQWTRAKGFDTFCPIGPWIDTDLDPADLAIECMVNGEVRQSSRTSLMVFKIPQLIAHISEIMTLEAGDLILTGTPAGVGPLVPGDSVVVELEGIGRLQNAVNLRKM